MNYRRGRGGRASDGMAGPPGGGGVGSSHLLAAGGIPLLGLAGAGVEEGSDLLGVLADHHVGRHDRAGEAAVANGEEHVVPLDLALVEVRAVGALAALELARGLGAVGVGGVERVAAAAALVEERRSRAEGRLVLRDGYLSLPAAGGEERKSERDGQDEAGRADHAAAYYPPPMHRPWVALAAGLALAGCGGSEKPKQHAVTVPAGRTLHVTAREYSFDPNAITVERAGELEITVENRGSLAHDLRVRRGGREIGGIPAFQDGRRSVHLRLARGRYRFLCTVGDHAKLGMTGRLRVR